VPNLSDSTGLDMLLAVVGFVVVAGWVAVAWVRRGRDPAYLDDPSILLPAPPPAMTAATAAIVTGGGGRLAFIAALLDLATRDEIAFVVEGRDHDVDRVGIAFHGGDTTDPQVLLNRRRPVGEGETWLLAELKAARAVAVSRAGGSLDNAPPPPEAIAAGMQLMATMARMSMGSAGDEDSVAARSAHERGLLSASVPDPAAFEAAYEQRTGHAMSDQAREGLEQLMGSVAAFSDPAAIERDPEGFAEAFARQHGHELTDDERAQVRQWAASMPKPGQSDPASSYIPAPVARSLQAPFLFGTLLQTYASRHGWTAELPLRARLHWYWVAIREAFVGVVLAILGSAFEVEPLRWLGGGIVAGAIVTALAAPAMARLSPLGAEMKAQLAAYRRTLAATFAGASSLDQARTASKLPWLETVDQTVVWGVALGLQRDVEAVLAREAGLAPAGAGRYVPAWYRAGVGRLTGGGGDAPPASDAAVAPAPPGPPAPIDDPAAMFAGIEAIGSVRTSSSS
jgi:hypothetical protein